MLAAFIGNVGWFFIGAGSAVALFAAWGVVCLICATEHWETGK